MSDDDLDERLAMALATRTCRQCGSLLLVPDPYELVEVHWPGAAGRWWCWPCVAHLCESEEGAP